MFKIIFFLFIIVVLYSCSSLAIPEQKNDIDRNVEAINRKQNEVTMPVDQFMYDLNNPNKK
ncbi:hypothetical protein [Chryseobacterium sp.]|uniref:hypothetical protein n=1 Tax=Chryseobacterium sp. TaxID=1871047 RepID=UPI002898B46C|nr:hypothetical protein [Chryseobacterium sp.]